jgi:preprotein translocase subunit SecG
MKKKLPAIVASIFLVLALSFFIFNIQRFNFSGFVAYDETQTPITKETALQAINESENIIKEMQENNLSVAYMNDRLIEAELVLKQAEYAEILRGDVNSTEKEKQEATEALRLINWEDVTYENVLFYTEDIQQRKDSAYLLLDKISVEEGKLNEANNETKTIFEQAKLAFSEERYNDTEKLLEDFNIALEKEKSESSILAGIRIGAKNFFQRYWIPLIIFLIIISVIGYFSYKRYEKKILKNKIRKMKTEEQVLQNLIKKAQTERFKENKISASLYKISMEKYQKRMQEIKEELPVLEERLRRFKNKKT